MLDHQWPRRLLQKPSGIPTKTSDVEKFFLDLVGHPLVLAPMARTALAWMIEWKKLQRSHTIFAPKWTSECVWEPIVKHSNPTINFEVEPDLVICVHKYALVHQAENIDSNKLIENSVDSLLLKSSKLFPNQGNFEVLSFPKIFGANLGAAILFKNADQHENFKAWLNIAHSESLTGLQTPYGLCESYERNETTIAKRLSVVSSSLPTTSYLSIDPHRLPPVIVFPLKQDERLPEFMMERHVDCRRNIRAPQYQRCALVPLHFGVDDSTFSQCLEVVISLSGRR